MRFLTRAECPLCDQARPVVMAAARRAGAGVDEADVDVDERLRAVYGDRVPVVLGPGETVLAEGVIRDRRALRRLIRRSARAGG